jgi:hypothetical protein
MTKPIHLPPDSVLESLRQRINPRLAGFGATVNFYRIEHPDRIDTGIVFSCGVRRAPFVTQARLSDDDADAIVENVKRWLADLRPESKWTSDPSEAS